MNRHPSKLDYIFLAFFPLFASVVSLIFRTNFLVSTLLFFGIPSLYFSLKQLHKVKKIFIFSIITAVPFGIVLDYIGLLNKVWYVPHSVFPFRLFSLFTLDEFIWGILIVYNLVVFYEYFFEQEKEKGTPRHFKLFVEIVLIMFALFIGIIAIDKDLLRIPYAYLCLGVLYGVTPMILFFKRFPVTFAKIVKAGAYFSLVTFLSEIVGVSLDHWRFAESHFVGWVTILNIRIPIEELFFFILIFGVALLCYYEYFDDDRK